MRKVIILLGAALIMALPFEANATLQCVAYAREVTGLNLKGDAWKWWEAADGLYDRGKAPREGAVMVFKRQGSMSHGHVAVVRKTPSSRIVLVDHANWAPHRSAGRGLVTESVPVMDVSPNNDWSQVRVWYRPSAEYGSKVYKTQGFVYRPGSKSVPVIPASLRVEVAAPAETAPTKTVTEPTATIEISTPVATQPVVAPVTASPARAVTPEENGTFNAGAWAEQA